MDISFLVFLLLYGGIANMSPVLLKHVPIFNRPIDAGKKFNNQRILGDGKTWRGLVGGVLITALVGFVIVVGFGAVQIANGVEFSYDGSSGYNALISNGAWNGLIAGYIGLGALSGDLVKSFIKRQVGIKRGVSWFPFDQVDWIIGMIVFVSLAGGWSSALLLLLPVGLVLHLITKWIGYLLKIENKPL